MGLADRLMAEGFIVFGPEAKAAIIKGFKNQLENKGFSFIELLTNCPTTWKCDPVTSLEFMEKQTEKYFECKTFVDKEERFAE